MDENSPPVPQRRQPARAVYLLPNLFTTGGLFGGFYAIIAAGQGHFGQACVAIFIAALLDGLDGRVARLTNTQSEFGVQYDSLADLVSFGMAPALVTYHWALQYMRFDGVAPGKLGWLAAFLYAACAALRLARFNSQVSVVDKRWFVGLASPAAAAIMASFVWTLHDFGIKGETMRHAAIALTVIVALLMVSNFRYTSFKGRGGAQGERVPFWALLLVVAALIALALYPPQTLLAVFALYALSGPVMTLFRRRRAMQEPA